MPRQTLVLCSLAGMIAATAATPCWSAESAAGPAANADGAAPETSAPFSLDTYRHGIERRLPKGWSIQVGRDKLTVTRHEKVLVGRHHVNPHMPPDPPALSIDNKVYVPGKGDPKKTVYIDEPDPTANGDTPTSVVRPMPYHLFEASPGRAVPETRNDVSYSHEQYVITIRFLLWVSTEDYRRLTAANKATEAKVEEIRKELESRRLTHKFDDFLPRTSDDARLIAQYEQLKKSVRPLPRFYTEGRTVEIEDTLNRQAPHYAPPPDFADGRVAKEVIATASQIEKMFLPYPPAR
jgi:hypothetical protein